jgi:hypothetical protein
MAPKGFQHVPKGFKFNIFKEAVLFIPEWLIVAFV